LRHTNPEPNCNSGHTDPYTHGNSLTNSYRDTYSTTNHTNAHSDHTYSNAACSDPDTNATADPDPDSESNTCRASPQPLDSDAGSDW
jgi:hypothetical protein